jgi:DNA-binding response OmpR family regulator
MSEKILVVDDEAPIRDLLKEFFKRRGYEVSTAGLASQVAEMVAKETPHLVILDLALPDGDGMEILQDLKAKDPGLRVLVLTGMGFDEDLLQEARDKGADSYVSKTLPLDQLYLEVRRVLKPKKD